MGPRPATYRARRVTKQSNDLKWWQRLQQQYRRAARFARYEIWTVDQEQYDNRQWSLIRLLRIILLAYRRSSQNHVQMRASALTFYMLMSVLPIAALMFAVARGFLLDEQLKLNLMNHLGHFPDVASWLIDTIDHLTNKRGRQVFTWLGGLVLLWSVIRMFNHIEQAFNTIWQVARPRTWFRKLSDYLAMVLIIPIVIVAASASNLALQGSIQRMVTQIEFLHFLSPLFSLLLRLVPILLVSLIFAMVYIMMPNTKVRTGAGLLAGLVAGAAFVVVQWVYFYFQIGVSRYNALYGSFAALPLLLVWMRLSWLILLLGAELCYAMQNAHLYEMESEQEDIRPNVRKQLAFLILLKVAYRFKHSLPPCDAREIADELGVSFRLTSRLLRLMQSAGLVIPVATQDSNTNAFMPAKPLENITARLFFQALDGLGADLNISRQQDIEQMEVIYQAYLHAAPQAEVSVDQLLNLPDYQRVAITSPAVEQPL